MFEDCKRLLKALDENALRDKIIIPLFEIKGREICLGNSGIRKYIDYATARTHGPNEPSHKCDILVIRHERGSTSFEGIQAKKGNIAGDTKVQRIAADAQIAFQCPYKGSDGKTHTLDKYYWITSGDLTPNGRTAYCRYLDPPFKRVEIWDCLQLIDELQAWAPHLLPPLELLRLQRRMADHVKNDEGVFASWYAYQAFRWHLRYKHGEISLARELLAEARRLLVGDPRAALFLSRTLATFYQMWLDLLDGAPQLLELGTFDPIVDIEKEEVRGVLQKKYPGTMYWLLSDVSFIMQQLELLAGKYVDAPSGLSTLQICQLLLRATYPPELEGIASRLHRLVSEELAEEGGKSIDGECSLCTGTAVSCLSLAGERHQAQAAYLWLTGLDHARYAYHPSYYTDAPATEHALHYAASVLEAALDFEYPDCVELRKVVRVFFEGSGDDSEVLQAWMKYRNIDCFEVYAYILPAILRFLLAGFPLGPEELELLRQALADLTGRLQSESVATGTPPWRPYVGRENLASLSLGCLLDIAECRQLARKTAGVFHYRAKKAGSRLNRTNLGEKLWDSNVDRTATFIDVNLLYWETVLDIESRGGRVEDLLPELA